MMRIFQLLFLTVVVLGCATRNVKFDRDKILKKYFNDYKISVDGKEVNLNFVILDKNNIKDVQLNNQKGQLQITQLKPTELIEIKDLKLDCLCKIPKGFHKGKISLIVVDGIPVIESLKNKLKIDPRAIKTLMIISEEKMKRTIFCTPYDGYMILITTK